MTRKEWSVLAVVLAAIVTLEVVGPGASDGNHEAPPAPGTEHSGEAAAAPRAERASQGTFRTVVLEVRGMT
jgi:hypothetical protein